MKITYRTPVQSSILVVIGLSFFGFSIGMLVHPGIGWRIIGGVMAACFILFAYRAARLAFVIDEQGVINRTLGSTRRIPWCEVTDISVGSARKSNQATPTATVILAFGDGRRLEVSSLSRYRTDSSLARLKETRDKIEKIRLSHTKSCDRCGRGKKAAAK